MSWVFLLAAGALARPLGVVVAHNGEWQVGWEACLASTSDPTTCQAADRRLRHTQDDAQRFAALLRGVVASEDILVFSEDPLRFQPTPAIERAHCGAEPCEASLEDIAARLGDAAGTGGDHELYVYVSSHGSVDGLHLQDGVVDQLLFLDRLEEAAGPGSQTRLFVSDACDSGRSGRAKGIVEASPSVWERPGPASVVVLNEAYEAPSLQGGVLSWLVRSALVGGGDYDASGQVSAMELADFLWSYNGGFTRSFAHEVRAPSLDHAVFQMAPERAGAVSLQIDEPVEASAFRWIVQVPAGDADLVLADVFVRAEEHRTLMLPTGSYVLSAIPYTGGSRSRMYMPMREGEQYVAFRCEVEISSATTTTCDSFQAIEQIELDEGALEVAYQRKGVQDLMQAHGGAVPLQRRISPQRFSPANRRLFGAGWRWQIGAAASSAPIARSSSLGGAVLGVSYSPPTGSAAWTAAVRASSELGGTEPSRAAVAEGLTGADLALSSNRFARLGIATGVAAGTVMLLTEHERQSTGTVGLDLGPSLGLKSGATTLWLQPRWSPRATWVRDNLAERSEPELHTARWGLDLLVRRPL